MNRNEHIARHKELHAALDELVADMISHTRKLPSKTTVIELMDWSFRETANPTERSTIGGAH